MAKKIVEKANRFIQTLHTPQLDSAPGYEYALFDFNHESRATFDYFAPSSQFTYGLPLLYLNPIQHEAVMDLLKASLSKNGFRKVQQIHALEEVLAKREIDNPVFIRNPKAYYISIYGKPSMHGLWSWRIQGHHLSLQWTIAQGEIISTTPQFLGAQPAEIKPGDEVDEILPIGERVLKDMENLARDLIVSFSLEQQQTARGQVPWDIDTTNVFNPLISRKTHRLEDDGSGLRGLSFNDLEQKSQDLLKDLVEAHASVQLEEVVQQRLNKIQEIGWGAVKFFFIGGHQHGDALYYRIRGKSFMIEYINKAFSQPNQTADHQHSVWREFKEDWGLHVI